MTTPVRPLQYSSPDFEALYGPQSAIAKQEYDQFLQRHRMLLDTLMNESLGFVNTVKTPQQMAAEHQGQNQGTSPLLGIGQPPQRPAARDELLAQAQFWGIDGAQDMDMQHLMTQIQMRRDMMPRDEQTSVGSAAMAAFGAASEAAGATSRVIGNMFGDIGAIPFAGKQLASIFHSEEAKRWMYDLSMKTSEFTEAARAAQPLQDKGAFDVLTASGKVAGYALPAILTWRALSSAGGYIPAFGAAGRLSAIARGAVQGGLSGLIMEGGSDEPIGSKVFSIGAGMLLGGASSVPVVGASLGLGTVGAGIGSQIGDTPEARTRHAIEGFVAGAALGVTPLALGAAAKLRQDMKSPFDAAVEDAVKADPMPGLTSGAGTQRATATMVGEQALPSGPDFEVHGYGNGQPEPQFLVRSEPMTSQPESINQGQTQRMLSEMTGEAPKQSTALVPAGRAAGKLAGTKVTGPDGQPLIMYHGTGTDFEAFDPTKADPEALYGPGFYHTDNPMIASGYSKVGYAGSGYAAGGWGVVPGPQIKMAKLNIQNPFDIDDRFTPEQATALLDKLEVALPGYDWETTRAGVRYQTRTLAGDHGVNAEDVYNIVAGSRLAERPQGPVSLTEPLGPTSGPQLGRTGLNNALQLIGYDGIKYIGGRITGGDAHNVWVAFNPEQVHSPWDIAPMQDHEAVSSADMIAKHDILTNSPLLDQTVGKAQVTDTDVVNSARASNPGGISVVRGLQMPLRVMQEAGPGVAFVQRPNGFDALVGPVSPQHIAEYTRTGVFTGQRVATGGTGQEGTVTGLDSRGLVKVTLAGGQELLTRPENLLPSTYSPPVLQAPQLWEGFKADLLVYMNGEAQKAGMAPVLGMDDPRVPGMMQTHMQDFLVRQGVTDPGMVAAVDADFNHRWVQDLRNLDYEMRDMQDYLMDQGVEAHNERELNDSHHIVQSIEEKAQGRGFIWVSRNGSDGGVLRDAMNPGTPDIPLGTDAQAHEFLARADRTLADHTPVSDVPMEVAAHLPTDLGFEPRLSQEDRGDSLANTVAKLGDEVVNDLVISMTGGHQVVGVGGGVGGGGTVPPGGPQGGYGGPQALPPGQPETLGGQFQRLRRADPARVHELENDFKGLLSSRVRYTRYGTLNLQESLENAGIDLGKAWEHYDNLNVARTHAFNEAAPWLNEASAIFKGVPRRIIRDGSLTRIHEIEDPNARYAAFYRLGESHGLSDAQIKRTLEADSQLTDFNHRFFQNLVDDPSFSMEADREISRYMSHVRARQAQGVQDPYDDPGLNPNVEFFAEYAREGNVQFRVMDARELTNHMVKAAMFKKWESAPWHDLVSAWQDPRVPEGIRNYMLDFAKISRYGYDPSGELAVRGIQTTVSGMLGTPITAREAQHLLNMPMGAMYMAMLAGKSSIFFRDAAQPLLALAKVRVPYMASTYGKVMKGASQSISRADENVLREMYQRGLDGGWIEKENPNIEGAGFFEEQRGQRDNELLHLTPEQVARREFGARVMDEVNRLPVWLVRPSESNLNTLKWYGRQGQLHRLIVGESAYQQALSAIKAMRASTIDAVVNGNTALEIPYAKVADDAFFTSFEPPIANKIKAQVDAGDDEGAAQTFAREVANWSQFRYGRREQPPVLRGNVGRMAFALGSWTGQFLEAMASSLSNGTARQKARFGMTVGAVSAAMYLAKHRTGWSFDRWAWIPNGMIFTGSPLLEKGMKLGEAAFGLANRAQNLPVSPTQQAAAQEEFGGAHGFLPSPMDFFPYAGYVRSAGEYTAAMQGTNPVEQMARYSVTGDRGSRVDSQRMIEEMARSSGGGSIPPGSLSPSGGQMPGSPGYRSEYSYPHQQPLHSYSDTLDYLVGGAPPVVNRQMGDATYGTYQGAQPGRGITQDSVFVNSGQQTVPIPRDFTVAHEMGHRLYYANEPLPSGVTSSAPQSPALQEIVRQLHLRSPYSNLNEGEGFAQAFAQALQSVRGQPYTPPVETGPANPSDVRSMQAWIQSRLAQRGSGYNIPSPPGAGAQQ